MSSVEASVAALEVEAQASTQDHGDVVTALEAQVDHGVPALEAPASTQVDHGVPAPLEAPAPEGTGKIVAAVEPLSRRQRRVLRRMARTASAAGAEGGEAAKRARPVPDPSRESAKVAPEPQEGEEGGSSAVAAWPKAVSHGAVSVIGRRQEMEDAFAVAAPFLVAAAAAGEEKEKEKEKEKEEGDGAGGEAEAEVEFFAVYDGHGGPRVADTCRDRLHVVLAEEVARLHLVKGGGEDGARWREAMEACFARVDDEVTIVERAEGKPDHTVGSTAVVVVVGPRHIVVANCGDSRAVLSRGGVPVPLSSDHKDASPFYLTSSSQIGLMSWKGYNQQVAGSSTGTGTVSWGCLRRQGQLVTIT